MCRRLDYWKCVLRLTWFVFVECCKIGMQALRLVYTEMRRLDDVEMCRWAEEELDV